ncbi:hypothetical protein KA005_73240 [bacterium]|nr:hypothetical protein [bacterium]
MIEITDRLLKEDRDGFKKLTEAEQKTLEKILLEIEGLDIKVASQDNVINNQVNRVRKKKKTSNNSQYKLTWSLDT